MKMDTTEDNELKDKIKRCNRIAAEKINQLNEKHAVVNLSGKARILNEFTEPIFNRKDFNFSTIQDFKSFYANEEIEIFNRRKNDFEHVNIANLWFKSKSRRQFKGIVFSPGENVEGYFNLWKGFAIEPKKGDWSLFRKHIYEVIVNENDEHFEWVMAWLARLVQYPGGESRENREKGITTGDRPGTAIVMTGKRGTGKGTFVDPFKYIFGTHFLHLVNQNLLTGRFNNHLKDAVVVFCDEGFFAGDKSAEGVIKGMITEDTLMIEGKNENAFAVKNHINLFIASNNDWVIPAGLEERRFFVTEVSDRYMQNHEYFKAIRNQMNNGGREAMLYDLLKIDITGVNLREAPKTDALMAQIENSMTPIQSFWYQCLCDGEIPGANGWTNWIESKELYNRFIEFSGSLGRKGYNPSPKQFGRKLGSICTKISPKYSSDQKYGYAIPDIETCRDDFEKILNMKLWSAKN